ncbi:MAG: superoxide dismutase [Bacteroidales bacterium]
MKKYLTLLAALSLSSAICSQIYEKSGNSSSFVLPPLPYSFDQLEPYISKETVKLHYGTHTKGYLDRVNALLKGSGRITSKDLAEVVRQSEGDLYNNAAQAWNHIFYFDAFSSHAQTQPTGELLSLIEKQWGSFEKFKTEFTKVATALFGSGWVWLVKNSSGELEIVSEPNAGRVLKRNVVPLLGIDVWEHAYYLDYQNRRAGHIDGLWNIIDWSIIQKRLPNV